MTYDSLGQTNQGFSAYDNWAQAHSALNWSLAFMLLIVVIIVIEKVRKR